MKNNLAKDDFSQLKKKLLLQLVAMAIGSVLFIFGLYFFVLGGRFADSVVAIIQYFLRRDYEEALSLYVRVFRNNMDFWIIFAILIAFFILFWFSTSRFIKYFREINLAINSLLDSDYHEVTLSNELAPVQNKITTVHQTLEKRKADKEQAEQRKNELIMYLAHDIRTPLTSIIGYLSLLDEAPEMPTEQRAKYTSITLDKAYRLENLINQFFEISRYNLNEMVLEPEFFDLHYLMLQLADELYPTVQAQHKQIQIDTTTDSLYLAGDPDKLARVFNNVLRNAISYSQPNSTIRIHMAQNEAATTITFTNTGKTIPAHKLDSIFEKFYRLDDARSTDIGGAGLGLAIAKEIVELHSGSISATSEDGVTTFTIILPTPNQASLIKAN